MLELFNCKLEIIADETLSNETCDCLNSSFYFLAPVYSTDSTSLYCGDRGNEIPLIHIPYINNTEEHFAELSFLKDFRAIETLWDSDFSNRFTKRQLFSLDSQLSKNAMKLCADYEKELKKSVVYLVPQKHLYNLKSNDEIHTYICTKCGKKLINVETASGIKKVCWDCRLGFTEPLPEKYF